MLSKTQEEEVKKLAEDNWPLLPAFVMKRLPGGVVDFLGGSEEAVADLGFYYYLGVRSWFASNRTKNLSTYVWNMCLWGSFTLIHERNIIRHPAKHDVRDLSEKLKIKARLAKRIKLFHGSEGRCEDIALLVKNTSFDDLCRQETSAAVSLVLDKLMWRKREVIKRRTYEGKSLETVAKEWNVTRERIRQIEVKARLRLEELLKKYYPQIIKDLEEI